MTSYPGAEPESQQEWLQEDSQETHTSVSAETYLSVVSVEPPPCRECVSARVREADDGKKVRGLQRQCGEHEAYDSECAVQVYTQRKIFVVELKDPVARPDKTLRVQPLLYTEDGLLINNCYRGAGRLGAWSRDGGEVVLETLEGKKLSDYRSGFA